MRRSLATTVAIAAVSVGILFAGPTPAGAAPEPVGGGSTQQSEADKRAAKEAADAAMAEAAAAKQAQEDALDQATDTSVREEGATAIVEGKVDFNTKNIDTGKTIKKPRDPNNPPVGGCEAVPTACSEERIHSVIPMSQSQKTSIGGPLQYGVIESRRSIYPSAGQTPRLDPMPLSEADWAFRNTAIGRKPSTVYYSQTAYRECQNAYTLTNHPPYFELQRCDLDATPWVPSEVNYTRLDLRNGGSVISSRWNGVEGIDEGYGVGICPMSYSAGYAGPLWPSPNLNNWRDYMVEGATDESGVPLLESQFFRETTAAATRWGMYFSAGGNLRDLVNICYNANYPLRAGAVTPAYTNGRYGLNVGIEGTLQRVVQISGDRASLARAYLPAPGTYVYKAGSISDAEKNAMAGRLTSINELPVEKTFNTVVLSISCEDTGRPRITQDDFSGPDKTMDRVWSEYDWRDEGRRSYYYGSDCDKPTSSTPRPGSPTYSNFPGMPPSTIPGSKVPAGGDEATGIYATCVAFADRPTIESAKGVKRTTGTGAADVLADNTVYKASFDPNNQAGIWVVDAGGAGWAKDRSKDPLDNSQRWHFGGLDKDIPNGISPSWKGTVTAGGLLDVTEVNNWSGGQPYATVPWADIDSQRTKRTKGVWESLETWNGLGSNDFPDGIGLAFDEASSLNSSGSGYRSWNLERTVRSRGVYRMDTETPGVTGVTFSMSTGNPVPDIDIATPSRTTAWVAQTFTCDSALAKFRAVTVQGGYAR